MRPLHLQMQGFGSFRDETTLDFTGVDYFALVGPTGNGKSTVIDAIGFALYGRVPRYDEKSSVRNIVSLGAQEARVQLDFTVGGDQYRATRVVRLRAGGQPSHQARLERFGAGGEPEPVAGQVREFSREIERIIGLGFDDFTRCVALPQGEFQRLLHDEPKQRRSVLVRLLNLAHYETVGARARAMASQHDTAVEALAAQAADFAGDAEALARIESALAAAAALRATIDAARPGIDALRARRDAARDAQQRHDDVIEQLEAVAAPRGLDAAVAEAAAVATALEAAVAESAPAETELERAEAVLAEQPDEQQLAALVGAHETLLRATEELTAAQAELHRYDNELVAAVAGHEAARAALDTADQHLERVRDANRAHALRNHLRPGDPCPVCGNPVGDLLERSTPPEFEAANTARKQAASELSGAEALRRQAEQKRERAAATAAERARTVTAQREELADATDAATAAAQLETVRAARARQRAAAQTARAARAALETARTATATSARATEAAWARYAEQRDALVARGLTPPSPIASDAAASWLALLEWVRATRPEHVAAAAAARTEIAELSEAIRVQIAPIADQVTGIGVARPTGDADLESLGAALDRTEQRDAQERARLLERHRQAAAIEDRIAQHRERSAVAGLLGKLLRSDRFIDWLVTEAFGTLIESASQTLGQLSGGQYSLRLSDQNEFEVIDHVNADATRPIRTLSGGETFQASLALALALSDRLTELAAEGAPRLEAIFIDEGFGTLDPESLDTVASSIELLGTSGRMVGVVTHVRELAERVPVRFEVRKDSNRSRVEMVTT
jgi:exonuclease SbcC